MNAAGNRSEELRRPRSLARWIRRLAIPIILGWTLLLVALNVLVPQLEVVAAKNSVSMSPSNAPSMQAMSDMGRLFEESESDSVALIVLENILFVIWPEPFVTGWDVPWGVLLPKIVY